MAEDFGDYSGEKLFDWAVRIGQGAGGTVAMEACDRLKAALENARKCAQPETDAVEEKDARERWAKLDMHEFTSIEDWPTLQDIISGKLDDCGIAHEWYREGEEGRAFLLFKAQDAPVLVRAFEEMSQDVDAAKDRAREELSKSLDHVRDHIREQRPARETGRARAGSDECLAEKAEMARAAAEEINREGRSAPERDRSRPMDHERARGR